MVCLVSFSSSVDLLSAPPKASILNVTKLFGNEKLINSAGIRDLITRNSTSLVQQMAKADPKQVKGIIALLKGLISSVNGERKVFENNVKNTKSEVIKAAAIHDGTKRDVEAANRKVAIALANLNKAKALHDNAKKELAYNERRLAGQVNIINKVINQLTVLIRVSWYSDGDKKTYADVKQSCESKGKRLCYYKEICPKKGVMIRRKFNHNNWTPIVISHNDRTPNWVQVGNSNKLCQLITDFAPVKGGNHWFNRKKANRARRYYPCCT